VSCHVGDRTKTSEQRRKILTVVEGNILFQNLDRDQQGQVVDTMWTKEIKKGTTIIKQGTLGDVFYVVESGSFDIFVSREGKEPIRVATRGPGTSFGELALMYNAPRAATVTATVDSIVWLVDRWTFRRILTNVENAKYKEYETFLKHVESFGVLLDYERSKIAESLEEVSFPAGHDIVKQGDDAEAFFILKKGEVIATKITPGSLEKQEVKRYRAGDYFGERALITGEVRAATCTTLMPCECLYLNKAAFISMLGPMDEIFRKRVAGYTNLESPRGGGDEKKRLLIANTRGSMGMDAPGSPTNFSKRTSMEPEENYLNKDIRIADLTPIGILGKGSFGVVTLVRDNAGQTYALKQVSKAQIVTLGQQEHIMSEKRVMAALNHPFLVRLYVAITIILSTNHIISYPHALCILFTSSIVSPRYVHGCYD
jgi:CRP-like cAMP-binding protein